MSERGVESTIVDYAALYHWLAVATKGLSDVARARIRDEITDHFHEALDAGLSEGLPEGVAAERAVESLGSARAARRAFRRTYLTRLDAFLVRRFIEIPSPAPSGWEMPSTSNVLLPYWNADRDRRIRPYTTALFFAMTVVATALETTLGTSQLTLHIGLLAFMASTALFLVFAVPALARRGKNRTAVTVGALSESLFLAAWFIAPAISRTHNLEPRLWILSAWVVLLGAAYAHALPKLSDHAERPA